MSQCYCNWVYLDSKIGWAKYTSAFAPSFWAVLVVVVVCFSVGVWLGSRGGSSSCNNNSNSSNNSSLAESAGFVLASVLNRYA